MDSRTSFMDSPLRGLTFCAVDCETTGVNPLVHEIIEVAAIRFTLAGGIAEACHGLVRPAGRISPESAFVHGITDEMTADAPPFSGIKEKLFRCIGDSVIVGHNPQFDISFLSLAAGKTELPSFQCVDTEKIARHAFPDLPNYRLGTVCSYLGLGLEYHRALPDAYGSAELFIRSLEVLDPEGSWRVRDISRLCGPLHRARKRAQSLRDRVSAAVCSTTMLIRYEGSDGEVTERKIEPFAVIRHGEKSYLRAYCHARKDIRLFKMDRMTLLWPEAAAKIFYKY